MNDFEFVRMNKSRNSFRVFSVIIRELSFHLINFIKFWNFLEVFS